MALRKRSTSWAARPAWGKGTRGTAKQRWIALQHHVDQTEPDTSVPSGSGPWGLYDTDGRVFRSALGGGRGHCGTARIVEMRSFNPCHALVGAACNSVSACPCGSPTLSLVSLTGNCPAGAGGVQFVSSHRSVRRGAWRSCRRGRGCRSSGRHWRARGPG